MLALSMFCLRFFVLRSTNSFFFSSRRRHTRSLRDWSSDVCSSDLRDLEHELLPLCREENVGVLPWSPLSGGFLSGKYRRDNPNPEGARRSGFQFPPIDEERGFDAVEALARIANEKSVTVAQVALA